MSFLYRAQPLLRTAAKPTQARLFSSTVTYYKSATEQVKDGLKSVDRTVSDAAVKGIDKGVEVKNAAASAVGIKASEGQGKAEELSGQAKGKAAELKGEAKGKIEEVKGKM